MSEAGKKYLVDILHSITLIEDFTKSTSDFEEYQVDLKTQSAVERQLAIIGEAINKFGKIEPAVALTNAHQIIGLRNRLIHAYESLDATIIWAVVQTHLPRLKDEVNYFLTT